jgi:hypothetical protein
MDIRPSDSLVEAADQNPASGLLSAIQGYLGGQMQQQRDLQTDKAKADIDVQKQLALAKGAQDMEGHVTPEMAHQMFSTISPEFGQAAANYADQFQKQNNRFLTVSEAKNGMDSVFEKIMKMKEMKGSNADKESNHQDTLEKQADDRITQVRGDQSLMRAEHQRDSAGMAYDTIAKAESEHRPLTELEQTDLVGQLWQARTGKAPTDSDMKLLNDRTAKRGFNHMVTYLTGNPSLVGASTDDTLANLKQFVKSTGLKADQQWEATMGPRLIKPTSLEQSRWDHLMSKHRGISFTDQMKTSDTTYKKASGSSDRAAKEAALKKKIQGL